MIDSQSAVRLLIMIDSRVDMINSRYMVIGDSHILYNSVPLYPDIMSDLQHLFWNNRMAECWFFDGMLALMDC